MAEDRRFSRKEKPITARDASRYVDNVSHVSRTNQEPERGRKWYRVEGLWTTRQMAQLGTREEEIQITLRELIIYSIFLILLLILAIGMTSTSMYYYSRAMKDLFLDSEYSVGERTTSFRTATTIADFWGFAETVMADSFFWDFWYTRQEPVAPTVPDDKKILYENKLLGVPRLRQVRVTDHSCMVHEDFRRTFMKCYDYYSSQSEDTEPFGKDVEGTAWNYASALELEGSTHWGRLAVYGGGGYIQDLQLDHQKTLDTIAQLKKNLWLDRGTRAVFLDFTVYNANINLFCIVKMVMEFPPTGGVIPSWSFRTVKLLRYVTPFDHFILACEILFLAFLVYYTLEEVREIVYFKFEYFKHAWNLLDFVILVISYTCLAFSVYRNVVVQNTLHDLLLPSGGETERYKDFTSLGFWQMQYNNAIAVLVFFAWVKVFKYINFNKTMSQLSDTLGRCRKDISGFAIMFFIVFCAFAQLGYLLFGTQVEAFSTFPDSVFTLLRTILGDFDYEAIEKANRFLGPIFFLSYIFFVFFVLLNMFLAIINDTYSEVKSELTGRRNQMEVSDFLSRGARNLFGRSNPEPKAGDGNISYEDIRNMLRKCNFTDLEIEMFFAKYNIEKGRMIGENDTKRLLDELDGKRDHTGMAGGGGISEDKFQGLEIRVHQMEDTIGDIIEKIDMIITKIESRNLQPKRQL